MVRAAAFLSLLLVAAAAVGAGILGVPSVTDGDTLRIGVERIRLHGIDAPESKQKRSRRRWIVIEGYARGPVPRDDQIAMTRLAQGQLRPRGDTSESR